MSSLGGVREVGEGKNLRGRSQGRVVKDPLELYMCVSLRQRRCHCGLVTLNL